MNTNEPMLKSCPCCNERAQYSVCADYALVFCTSCGIQTMPITRFTNTEARKAFAAMIWNFRAEEYS